jgi:hypothetical protein
MLYMEAKMHAAWGWNEASSGCISTGKYVPGYLVRGYGVHRDIMGIIRPRDTSSFSSRCAGYLCRDTSSAILDRVELGISCGPALSYLSLVYFFIQNPNSVS